MRNDLLQADTFAIFLSAGIFRLFMIHGTMRNAGIFLSIKNYLIDLIIAFTSLIDFM